MHHINDLDDSCFVIFLFFFVQNCFEQSFGFKKIYFPRMTNFSSFRAIYRFANVSSVSARLKKIKNYVSYVIFIFFFSTCILYCK